MIYFCLRASFDKTPIRRRSFLLLTRGGSQFFRVGFHQHGQHLNLLPSVRGGVSVR